MEPATGMIIGSGISALGSLAGGILGSSSAERSAREANALQLQISREQARRQEQFAKMGIRWRVADARAAGLSPLAALGAAGISYRPQQVFPKTAPGTDYGISAAAGHIGRAIYNIALQKAEVGLEKDKTELGMMKAQFYRQMANLNTQGHLSRTYGITEEYLGPSYSEMIKPPVPWQSQRGIKAGRPAMFRHFRHNDGSLKVLPTQEISESAEAIPWIAAEMSFEFMKDRALRLLARYGSDTSKKAAKIRSALRFMRPESERQGYEYRYNAWNGRWYERRKKGKSYLFDK